jgi:hypothetical protein
MGRLGVRNEEEKMIYEVWIKNGINLEYFGSREAAEMYIEKYIKRRELVCKMTREEFEIRERIERTI